MELGRGLLVLLEHVVFELQSGDHIGLIDDVVGELFPLQQVVPIHIDLVKELLEAPQDSFLSEGNVGLEVAELVLQDLNELGLAELVVSLLELTFEDLDGEGVEIEGDFIEQEFVRVHDQVELRSGSVNGDGFVSLVYFFDSLALRLFFLHFY